VPAGGVEDGFLEAETGEEQVNLPFELRPVVTKQCCSGHPVKC
jgi:hypothetical protein